MSKMDTRKRLSESNFFLDKLSYAYDDEIEFPFFLSAFLNSWRSVLDIMLYDFCEFFSLGFTREDKINHENCMAVARVLNKTQAIEAIKWWKQKQGILSKNPLWKKRNFKIHKGNVPILHTVYLLGSGANSPTLSGYDYGPCETSFSLQITSPVPEYDVVLSFSDDPQKTPIEWLCADAQTEMVGIVEEAETKFGVKL